MYMSISDALNNVISRNYLLELIDHCIMCTHLGRNTFRLYRTKF